MRLGFTVQCLFASAHNSKEGRQPVGGVSRGTNTWRLLANSVVRDNPIVFCFFFPHKGFLFPAKKKKKTTTDDHQPAGSSQSSTAEKSNRKEECERNVRNKKEKGGEKKTGSGERNIKCSAGGREKRNSVHTRALLYSHSWRLSARAPPLCISSSLDC